MLDASCIYDCRAVAEAEAAAAGGNPPQVCVCVCSVILVTDGVLWTLDTHAPTLECLTWLLPACSHSMQRKSSSTCGRAMSTPQALPSGAWRHDSFVQCASGS